MIKTIHEVLTEVQYQEGKDAKIATLRKYDTVVLRLILECFFRPDIHFYTTELPAGYKPNDSPVGLSYMTLHSDWKQLRYFIKNRPESEKLTDKKKDLMLLRFLEGLDSGEAQVVIHTMKKDPTPYHLRKTVVREAFPDLGI